MSVSELDKHILARRKASANKIKKAMQFMLVLAVLAGGVYAMLFAFDWTSQSTEQNVQIHETPASDSEVFTAQEQSGSALREQLQSALSEANAMLAELENDPGRNNWNRQGIETMQNNLRLAFGHYAQEDYKEAGAQLKLLIEQYQLFENTYQQAWQGAFEQAQQAFEQPSMTQAKLHIQQVLNWYPDNAAAQDLSGRIEVWQQVQDLRDKLRVAEVENNTTQQLQIMRDILALDAHSEDIAQKYQKLKSEMQEQQFAAVIVQVITALEENKLEQATQALQKARNLDAQRPEIAHLEKQLQYQKEQISIEKFEQQISAMQKADNWLATQKISESARKAHPELAKFALSYELATQVLSYQQQLQNYLEQPERLTDSNIRQNAQALLTNVQEIEVASATLRQQAELLRAELRTSTEKVAVTLVSDGKTDIRVLGVGNVGRIKLKSIELLPGDYRIEGRREGYRSKIIQIKVATDGAAHPVELICDEKI